jgi:predicted negative regulator of RcsB-dependent stress response
MGFRVETLLKEIKKLPAYWKAVSLAKASYLLLDTQKKYLLIEEAQELLKDIDDVYLRSLATSEIASIIYTINKNRSIQLFREAFKQSLDLHEEERDASLEWVIYYLTQVGEHKLAEEFVRSIKNSFYKDLSYLCILYSFARKRMTSHARNTLKNIKRSYFRILAKACIANEIYPSDKHLSESLFASALKEVDRLDHFNAACVLSHLLYLREKFMKENLTTRILNRATAMLEKIRIEELRDIVSARLTPVLVKHSRYLEAQKFLSEIRDPFYASLARVRISFILMPHQKEIAFKHLSSVTTKGIQDSRKYIIKAKKAQIIALGGKLTEAIELAKGIEDESYRGVAMKSIVDALVEKEHIVATELLKV